MLHEDLGELEDYCCCSSCLMLPKWRTADDVVIIIIIVDCVWHLAELPCLVHRHSLWINLRWKIVMSTPPAR